MSIRLVQQASQSTAAQAGTATFSSNVVAGNIIIMFAGHACSNSGSTIVPYTVTTGWTTFTTVPTAAGNALRASWRYANPADGNVYGSNAGATNAVTNIWLYELSGLDMTSYGLGLGSAIASSALTVTSSGIAGGAGIERFLLGAVWAQGGAMTSPTVTTSGWTASPLLTGNRSLGAYRYIISDDANYNVTFTWTTTNRPSCCLIMGLYGSKTDLSLLGTG
jgi:hypothetical protein